MCNPWKEVHLDDYENHMKLDSVMQLQTMNEMMKEQLFRYGPGDRMILGIAGGNGLNHIAQDKGDKIYGVDINNRYLDECVKRYPELDGCFIPIEADLTEPQLQLPKVVLLIANLLIEYIGYEAFQGAVQKAAPEYISCIIQINEERTDFISHSPYINVLNRLEEVHHAIDETGLTQAMGHIEYELIYEEERKLPNGKKLVCLDYGKQKHKSESRQK